MQPHEKYLLISHNFLIRETKGIKMFNRKLSSFPNSNCNSSGFRNWWFPEMVMLYDAELQKLGNLIPLLDCLQIVTANKQLRDYLVQLPYHINKIRFAQDHTASWWQKQCFFPTPFCSPPIQPRINPQASTGTASNSTPWKSVLLSSMLSSCWVRICTITQIRNSTWKFVS